MKTPHELADSVVVLSSEYSTMSEELADILKIKASKWAMFRVEEDIKSDKQADRRWDSTAEGLREMQLRLLLKASEKQQSAIKSLLRILEVEGRNQF